MLPTFIGIGAQRAGTTWAYNCLAEHPEVYMTQKKELHFFYVNYGRGLEWYEQQFAGAEAYRARGEITPDYLYHEEALRNIAKDVPGVKLFVVLRSPVDRAISQYALHKDKVDRRPFAEVATPDSEFVDRGLYFKHLQKVHSLFPADRVKVLLYDDLERAPARFVAELYRYVGVDDAFRPPSLGTRYNRVVYPDLQKLLMRLKLGWLIDAVKRTSVGERIRRGNSGSRREEGTVTDADVRRLAAWFRDDVRQLEQMLGRDLSHWLD